MRKRTLRTLPSFQAIRFPRLLDRAQRPVASARPRRVVSSQQHSTSGDFRTLGRTSLNTANPRLKPPIVALRRGPSRKSRFLITAKHLGSSGSCFLARRPLSHLPRFRQTHRKPLRRTSRILSRLLSRTPRRLPEPTLLRGRPEASLITRGRTSRRCFLSVLPRSRLIDSPSARLRFTRTVQSAHLFSSRQRCLRQLCRNRKK